MKCRRCRAPAVIEVRRHNAGFCVDCFTHHCREQVKRAAAAPDATLAKLVEWAGRLHEVGMSISHDGFHKHGAYIVEHADMPGFSSREQGHLAFLVLACRGRLAKVAERLSSKGIRAAVLALRIAVLVHHARTAMAV